MLESGRKVFRPLSVQSPDSSVCAKLRIDNSKWQTINCVNNLHRPLSFLFVLRNVDKIILGFLVGGARLSKGG